MISESVSFYSAAFEEKGVTGGVAAMLREIRDTWSSERFRTAGVRALPLPPLRQLGAAVLPGKIKINAKAVLLGPLSTS